MATDRGVELKHGYNAGILEVDAVPDQIEVVFRVLIENALKYSYFGSVDRHRVVDITYRDQQSALEVSITNFGCAIAQDEISDRTIFELGYRGKESQDRGRSGTGSGLHIADSIVRTHGGRIEVESRPMAHDSGGVGPALNTFRVVWPHYQATSDGG